MNAGHTLITIFAMMLLTTILLNFYGLLSNNNDTIAGGQDGVLMTTLATSYLEIASGLAFDEITDSSEVAIGNPNMLSTILGRDNAGEDSIYHFNDFDDFNNFPVEEMANGTTRKYKTLFKVQYVNPGNIESVSALPTFVKRMDLKTWRTFPPGKTDTLNLSMVMGYFHFD
jgi:hypothetical protein